LNRVADVLFEPLFAAIVLLALSYLVRRRAPRAALALPGLAMGLLVVFALPDVANALEYRLEHPVLTSMRPDVTYDAVIVLGGVMSVGVASETGAPAWSDTVDRVTTAFDLLCTGRAKNAILSGGTVQSPAGTLPPESRLVARQLTAWGIDAGRLALDERSLDTHENAVESARIAREHGWTRLLLVTSAAHMSRARGCFAREGLLVDTLATDFQATEPGRHSGGFLPRAHALAESTGAIREAVGRLVYRARGWTL
jgi:uncharacterized SAM-binding protein YcdF (DUF218 family)